jgi:hypothetical protein
MTTTTYTITENTLALMLTENTGTHMLDSGGVYGRAWQRNAGKVTEDFMSEPEATADGWGVTVSVFHYLRKRVTFSPLMQARLDQFAEALPDAGWFGVAQEFADSLEDSESHSWNTYNDDGSALSQVLQGITFTYRDEVYVLLQIHGGADVRGGYTKPQAFKVTTGEMPDQFPYDHIEYALECPNDHEHSVSWRSEWISFEGSLLDNDDSPIFDSKSENVKCRQCDAVMSPHAPEPY